MRNVSLTVLAVVGTFATCGSLAHSAQQVTTTRTVYELSDFPDTATKVKAICESDKFKLSDKAKAICTSGKWPGMTKAGAFRNSGSGAEFNTLMRQ